MPKLPRLTGQQVITVLRKAGFEVLRVKGSHHFMRHPDGRRTVVPVLFYAALLLFAGLLIIGFAIIIAFRTDSKSSPH
jgi:hypothetical protein